MAKPSIKEQIKNSRILKREIIEATQAVYDVPMAPEMMKEMAFIAFMNTASFTTASIACGIPEPDIRRWADEEDWNAERKEHYKKVHETNVDKLQTLAEKKASIANDLLDIVKNDVLPMITNDEETNVKDKMMAIKYAIESVSRLTGETEGDEKKEAQDALPSGLSEGGQNVMIQIFQQFNKGNESLELTHPDDILDMLEDEDKVALEEIDDATIAEFELIEPATTEQPV